jgi:2-phospho-L-lactate guanylyltransferase
LKAILIPVKEFSRAKQRLAMDLSGPDRASLAQAMFEDVFDVVAAVRRIDAIFVVSSEPVALARARGLGWQVIPESRQRSESDSVDFASHWCADRGVGALLRLPIDMPLVEPDDIEVLFEKLEAPPAAVLVPSRDGTGTNALLRTPPALFPSHFGPGSFAKHLAEAKSCGARAKVVRNPRLELDVDDLQDLRLLSRGCRPGTATALWLEMHGTKYDIPQREKTGEGRSAANAVRRQVAGR